MAKAAARPTQWDKVGAALDQVQAARQPSRPSYGGGGTRRAGNRSVAGYAKSQRSGGKKKKQADDGGFDIGSIVMDALHAVDAPRSAVQATISDVL